jgi:hypothetical protein
LRELWPLLNRTHHVDGVVVRIACLLLLIIFLVSSIIRHIPDPAMLAIRVAVVAYTAIGIAVGPRFAWPSLRLYTVGMALVLPTCTAALEILRGNHPADLAITAISIFGPMPFLQTGVDVLVVSAALLSGIVGLVSTLGPPGVPTEVADVVLGGAVVAGAATALVLIAFRGRISEMTKWVMVQPPMCLKAPGQPPRRRTRIPFNAFRMEATTGRTRRISKPACQHRARSIPFLSRPAWLFWAPLWRQQDWRAAVALRRSLTAVLRKRPRRRDVVAFLLPGWSVRLTTRAQCQSSPHLASG